MDEDSRRIGAERWAMGSGRVPTEEEFERLVKKGPLDPPTTAEIDWAYEAELERRAEDSIFRAPSSFYEQDPTPVPKSEPSLADFLLVRIDEEERAAHMGLCLCGQGFDAHTGEGYRRIVAGCEARRVEVRFLRDLDGQRLRDVTNGISSIAYSVLCRMAQPYVDHADFREEWRV